MKRLLLILLVVAFSVALTGPAMANPDEAAPKVTGTFTTAYAGGTLWEIAAIAKDDGAKGWVRLTHLEDGTVTVYEVISVNLTGIPSDIVWEGVSYEGTATFIVAQDPDGNQGSFIFLDCGEGSKSTADQLTAYDGVAFGSATGYDYDIVMGRYVAAILDGYAYPAITGNIQAQGYVAWN